MYAVVEIAGKQFRVTENQRLQTPSLGEQVGQSITFSKVLLIQGTEAPLVGSPAIDQAKVTGKVLAHGREKKIIVFKKKRRKGYKKSQGHRQGYTELMIEKIHTK